MQIKYDDDDEDDEIIKWFHREKKIKYSFIH